MHEYQRKIESQKNEQHIKAVTLAKNGEKPRAFMAKELEKIAVADSLLYSTRNHQYLFII